MRRLLALVIATALVVSSGTAASLHVHEYLGHNHPEHDHGIASHHHTAGVPADVDHHGADDDHRTFEAVSCDAGRHAVSVRTACASVPQVHIDLAEVPGPSFAILATPIRSPLPITDIRVHGPPFLHQLPVRAPPVSLPA